MIRVKGPDGSTFAFPEGTDEKTINDAMAKHYGEQAKSQPTQAPQAAQPAPQGAQSARTPQWKSAAAGAADAATFGFADEIAARNEAIGKAVQSGDYGTAATKALGYLTAPGRALYGALGLNSLAVDTSDDPQEAARRQEFRGAYQKAQQDNPWSYFGGQVGGGLAIPLGAAAGLPQTATTAQRAYAGARAALPQATAYGYGSGQGDQREESAAVGAVVGPAIGATVGLAAPALTPITKRAAKVGGNALSAFEDMMGIGRAPQPNALNMTVGPIIPASGGRRAPTNLRSQPVRSDPTMEQLALAAERAKKTPGAIQEELAAAAADPRGRVAADIIGPPAIRRAGTLAELPGETQTLAPERLKPRVTGQLERLQSDLDGVMPGARVVDTEAAIEEQFKAASKGLYEPALAQRVDTTKYNQAAGILTRLPMDVLRRAQKAMTTVVEGEGRLPAQLNETEFLHFMKVGLDDAIGQMKAEGLQGSQLRALMKLKKDYLSAVDNAIPGYQNARQVWAGTSELRDALQAGEEVFGGTGGTRADAAPDRIVADLAELSEAGKAAFEVGARSAIRGLLQSQDKQGGANVAAALRSTAKRNVIKAVLGPERANKFFAALDQEFKLYGDAQLMLPNTNSRTFGRTADAVDQLATEPGNFAKFNPKAIFNVLLQEGTSGIREGYRNKLGNALLTPVDNVSPDYNPATAEELVRLLSRRMAQRAAQERTASRFGGATGATAGSGGSGQQ